MSKQKKAKKERRTNVYAGASLSAASAPNGGGGAVPAAPAVERKATSTIFDYSYVKKDLARIGVLAGSFITILIVLSFFINR